MQLSKLLFLTKKTKTSNDYLSSSLNPFKSLISSFSVPKIILELNLLEGFLEEFVVLGLLLGHSAFLSNIFPFSKGSFSKEGLSCFLFFEFFSIEFRKRGFIATICLSNNLFLLPGDDSFVERQVSDLGLLHELLVFPFFVDDFTVFSSSDFF